jgi:hypothetical protein
MRDYDPARPLLFLHVPKTGGLGVRAVWEDWFGDRLLRHYPNPREERPPPRHDLEAATAAGRPPVVYGHFNRSRGFGAEHYYPGVSQFATILRDPFEREVSSYYYLRRAAAGKKAQERVPSGSLAEHLRTTRASYLNFFPREVTADNWRGMLDTLFVEVGVLEHVDESLRRLAAKLGKPAPPPLPRVNATARDDQATGALREEFVAARPLEYAIYRDVLARYA